MKPDDVFTAESPLWAIMNLSIHPQYMDQGVQLTDGEL